MEIHSCWRYFILSWTDNGKYTGQRLEAICRCPADTISLYRYGVEVAWVTNYADAEHTPIGRIIGPSMTVEQFESPDFDWGHINSPITIDMQDGRGDVEYSRWTLFRTDLFNLVATAEWAAGLSFAHSSLGWRVSDPSLPDPYPY